MAQRRFGVRIYNEGPEPVSFDHGGMEYVINPKSGIFKKKQKSVPGTHPRTGQKIFTLVPAWEKVGPWTGPPENWIDVDERVAAWVFSSSCKVFGDKSGLKTYEDIAVQKRRELEEIDADLVKKRAERKELDKLEVVNRELAEQRKKVAELEALIRQNQTVIPAKRATG